MIIQNEGFFGFLFGFFFSDDYMTIYKHYCQLEFTCCLRKQSTQNISTIKSSVSLFLQNRLNFLQVSQFKIRWLFCFNSLFVSFLMNGKQCHKKYTLEFMEVPDPVLLYLISIALKRYLKIIFLHLFHAWKYKIGRDMLPLLPSSRSHFVFG